jgi:hypothetical protein
MLLECARAVGGIKVKEFLLLVHAEEGSDILVVRKCRRKANETDLFTCLLHPPDCPRNDSLENRPTFIVQRMSFVNNDEPNEGGVACVGAFPCDNVPFLGGSDNDLGLNDLLLGHLGVPCEFSNLDAKDFEAGREVADHFLYESFHGRNVDDLEAVKVEFAGIFITPFG